MSVRDVVFAKGASEEQRLVWGGALYAPEKLVMLRVQKVASAGTWSVVGYFLGRLEQTVACGFASHAEAVEWAKGAFTLQAPGLGES